MDQERIEKEKKFNIRWKHRWKRIFGNVCLVLGILIGGGVIAGVTYNYVHINKPVPIFPEQENLKDTYNEIRYGNDTQDRFITVDEMFDVPLYQYLVFFYADNCPHCHDEKFEKFVSNYADAFHPGSPKSTPVKMYFIRAKSYHEPLEIFEENNLVEKEEESRQSNGATNPSGIKFYGFPTMFLLKGEGEDKEENMTTPKHIEHTFIGNEEITKVLKANLKLK